MDPFVKSAFRILLLTGFLLALAWVCMKGMEYGGRMTPEDLMMEGRKILEGLGDQFRDAVEKVRYFIGGMPPM